MSDPFDEMKRELYELMQRMRRERFVPPPGGLTPTEGRVMVAIDDMRRVHGEVRPGRVAEFTHMTPSALSQTFKTLEEKGLIERRRAGGDFRGVTVSLTEEGQRFAVEGRRLHSEHLDQVMAYVGEEDMAHLVRIMRKVVEFHEERGAADARPHGGEPAASGPRGASGAGQGGGDASCA